MNATVAVALITSLSTLAAGALTAAVSALTSRRQLRHQADIARAERAELRSAARLEALLGACETFLAQVDAAYRTLDEGWHARAARTGPRPWPEGFAARRRVDEAYVRLQLSGPGEVAAAGAAVVRALGAEFRRLDAVAAAGEGDGASPAEREPDSRNLGLRARRTGTEAFVAAVRGALEPGGDVARGVLEPGGEAVYTESGPAPGERRSG